MVQSSSAEKTSGLRRIFNDLSFPQVTAGALAAVTSMLLASNVGIAGTVIGVAVSSVVSAVASQVYKQFILASAEKVKDLAPTSLVLPGKEPHKNGDEESFALPEEVTASVERVVPAERRTRAFNPYETCQTAAPAAYAAARARVMRVPPAMRNGSVSMGDEYARSAILQARAARERKARIQRNTIIVAVASAVVAVAVCALMINIATQGKGLGPQMPTATYVQKWSGATSQQNADIEGSDKVEDVSGNKNPGSENKTPSSSSKTENAVKPNTNMGSVDDSSNGSVSGSSNTQTPQLPQAPDSSDTTQDGSSIQGSESQDGQDSANGSGTTGSPSSSASSSSKPTGASGSSSGANTR